MVAHGAGEHLGLQHIYLELLGHDGRRKEAAEVVRVALLLGEGQALVVARISQEGVAAVA